MATAMTKSRYVEALRTEEGLCLCPSQLGGRHGAASPTQNPALLRSGLACAALAKSSVDVRLLQGVNVQDSPLKSIFTHTVLPC